MQLLVVIIHVLTAIALIGLVLLQQGKGAEMGASFGAGGSNTVFGSAGGVSFFAKVTALLVLVFFCTSITLAVLARNAGPVSGASDLPFDVNGSVPATEEVIPGESFQEIPQAPGSGLDSAPSDIPTLPGQ